MNQNVSDAIRQPFPKRGEIYFTESTYYACGSEQTNNRPFVVVSNNKNNMFSSVITAVPFTSKQKKQLPTHVDYIDEDSPVSGTILCEQIQTVSKSRLGSYAGEVDWKTMKQIEEALKVQLGLSK